MVHSIAATTIRELGARHSLSNLSVHDLVEEFARHRNYSLHPSCLIRLRH
ncbi:hypothetical protein HBH48_247950 [Parastagonospora nodorum]|nr:hypothetical protein HBH48_247950 [Parastagonospora nodorum]